MQRADLRDKYHLRGNCATDIARACFCALCDLTQQEKESEYRELLANNRHPGGGVVQQPQGYQMQRDMEYPSAEEAPTPSHLGYAPPQADDDPHPGVPVRPVQLGEKSQEAGGASD
jgi:hypothetical protein